MKQVQGFTLMELMVTVVILAIIAAFAAPSYNNLVRQTNIDSNTTKIRGALTYARSESANLSSTVTVCSTTNFTSCDGDENWQSGWVVFLDLDGDGLFDDDADSDLCETNVDDCILRVWEALPPGAVLAETNGESFVTFNEQGAVVTGKPFNLELAIGDCGVAELRTLTLNPIGRLQVSTGDCP
jgi:type IV fimbrial biogenesis protein FimT